jgi:plasmid stabilization system protein ParE
VAKKIGDSTLREFALVGARGRLAALEAEIASLVAAFPELRRGRGAAKAVASRSAGPKRGRKRPMSAAERKQVSERMRKYWAERRAKR